jgi:hypothetical protein
MIVQDGDEDLQKQMAEAQAQMQAKQALRQILGTLDQEMAQLAGSGFRSASVSGFRSASAFPRPRPSRGFATFVDQLSRQILNNARSKLLQTASHIEKAKADTENAMVQNIKQ